MNRLWFGIALLVLFLGLGIISAVVLQDVQQPVIQALETAAEQSLSGNLEAGAASARQAQQNWDRNWHGVAAVAMHGPMDEIDSLFAQLPAYARSGKTAEFAACCARLAKLVEAIGDAQGFNWWNLL